MLNSLLTYYKYYSYGYLAYHNLPVLVFCTKQVADIGISISNYIYDNHINCCRCKVCEISYKETGKRIHE